MAGGRIRSEQRKISLSNVYRRSHRQWLPLPTLSQELNPYELPSMVVNCAGIARSGAYHACASRIPCQAPQAFNVPESYEGVTRRISSSKDTMGYTRNSISYSFEVIPRFNLNDGSQNRTFPIWMCQRVSSLPTYRTRLSLYHQRLTRVARVINLGLTCSQGCCKTATTVHQIRNLAGMRAHCRLQGRERSSRA